MNRRALSDVVEVEDEKVGIVAGPPFMDTSGTGPLEVPHDVAIGIEHTHRRNGDERQPLLPPCLAQQRFRPDHGGSRVIFA